MAFKKKREKIQTNGNKKVERKKLETNAEADNITDENNYYRKAGD